MPGTSGDGHHLHIAAEEAYFEVVQHLIDHGANANAKRDDSSTPLHLAARGGHLKVVRVLLNHGGDPHSRGHWGETPFQWASRCNFPQVAELL